MIGPSHPRRHFLRLAGAIAAAAVSPGVLRAEQQDASTPSTPDAASANVGTFDGVWQTVRDRFYDPHLHGLNWMAVRERYLPYAAGAASESVLAGVINSMLS